MTVSVKCLLVAGRMCMTVLYCYVKTCAVQFYGMAGYGLGCVVVDMMQCHVVADVIVV